MLASRCWGRDAILRDVRRAEADMAPMLAIGFGIGYRGKEEEALASRKAIVTWRNAAAAEEACIAQRLASAGTMREEGPLPPSRVLLNHPSFSSSSTVLCSTLFSSPLDTS